MSSYGNTNLALYVITDDVSAMHCDLSYRDKISNAKFCNWLFPCMKRVAEGGVTHIHKLFKEAWDVVAIFSGGENLRSITEPYMQNL